MAVTEQQQHQLLTWFEERMDEERAATMMELLPPAGSDQLATKGDLAVLRADMAVLRGAIKDDLLQVQRTFVTWLIASQAAVITAVGVAAGVVIGLR